MRAICLLLCTEAAWAQQTAPSPSVNDQGSQPTMSSPSSETNESSGVVPLSGIAQFQAGSATSGPSYLLPALSCTEFADTDPTSAPGLLSVQSLSTCVGNLTLQKVGRRSQFNLGYAGGAYYFNRRVSNSLSARPGRYGTFQGLTVSESVIWRRWRLLLIDQPTYLPESAFGFSGFAGLGSFGSGEGGASLANPPALNPTLGPTQTILVGRARILSNVVAGQVQYNAGRRSAFTASGGYGNLHFLDPGFIDSEYWNLAAGYTLSVGRRDEVGVSYSQGVLQPRGLGNRQILTRGVQFSYGHRLTGRLAAFLSAGPTSTRYQLPQGGSVTKTFWNTSESLQYGRNSVAMSFGRYTTTGSGVLAGAETEVATVSFNKQLSRRIHGALGAGYARNQELTQGIQAGPRRTFQTGQGSAILSREFGRTTSFYVSYQLQRQTANIPFCFGNTCGRALLRHVAGLGFNWHSRPIALH